MAKNPNQKLKLLYLYQILMRKTDAQHKISMDELLAALSSCGIAAAPPEWRPAALPPWNAGYVSAAQIQRRQDLRSNTAAYRYLFDRGAIHVQLRGKVLWHIPDAFCRVPFAAACPPV